MYELSANYTWGDVYYRLEFTTGGLLEIAGEFGDAWSVRLNALFTGDLRDLDFVADIATGGLFDPSVNVPKAPFVNAIYRAYELSWSGRDIDKEASDEKEGGEGSGKKLQASLKSLLSIGRNG